MRRLIVVLAAAALFVTGALPALSAGPTNYRTHLTGDEEVPAVETQAQGQAIFKLSADGETLHYKLIVANIEDVLMAHIHLAPAGENGDVVVWLYPDGPPPQLIEGRFQGVLAKGEITADDLVGDLEGQDLGALIDLINAGGAYVNVHTSTNMGGEVRGQIG
ncbi:MAG TPA: CHRD domain-containing protein [Acidimicrobiia bacterium]|nr:CHRD domain-containing protein [Acidimicrobiia bacterium]